LLLFFLYRIGQFLACYLPSSLAYWLADGLAFFCFFFPLGKYRKYKIAVLHNVSLVLGKEKSHPQVKRMAREVFRNFGRYLREFLWLDRLKESEFFRLVTPMGVENLDAALARGKGTIILSAHFGNWEWGGITLAQAGYKLNFLVRDHANSWTNCLFDRLRIRHQVQVISLKRLKKALKALKKNEVVAILVDEESKNGMEVNLFGSKVCLSRGPFRIAFEMDTFISPAFMIRERKTGRQKIIVEPPILVRKSGEKEKDIRMAAGEFGRILQKYLSYYPDHWLLLQQKRIQR